MRQKKYKLRELQVGVLTLAAIVVLVLGMLWLKNIDLTKGKLLYMADFSQVEGLQVGDRVQVRGIRMGEVGELQMLPGSVRVQMLLDEAAILHQDAVVTLGEKGIVGEVVIEIDPGQGPAVAEGHIFQGRNAGTIAAMTDAAGDALQEMRALTAKVTELVDEVKSSGKVVETLAQANVTLEKIDHMVDENHSDIRVVLENLKVASADLRDLTASGSIDSTFARTAQVMAQADTLLAALGRSAAGVDRIVQSLEQGDGSAAMLLNDPGFYQRADSTLTSLQRLLDEVRRNPKKFVKFSVLDF
jgi:phospholipid/cholesterol/gamma-HCH transport system substrate-binding protein